MGTILDLTMGALQPVLGKKTSAREPSDTMPDRKALELELQTVRRKELELMRAIAVADQPELGDALNALEEHAGTLARLDKQRSEGPTAAEEQRRAVLIETLSRLAEKRQQLDAQTAACEQELHALGDERAERLRAERRVAQRALVATMAHHESLLRRSDVDLELLLPGISVLFASLPIEDEDCQAELVLEDDLTPAELVRDPSTPPALP